MIKGQTKRSRVDTSDPTKVGAHTFHEWLQLQLKARHLTQRQLAQKSGVDHSTISRLVRGDRVPSLRTAGLLARSLDMSPEIDGPSFATSGSPAARVEYALRSDDLLTEAGVREIMDIYLAARRRRARGIATASPGEAKSRTPVPIVVEVAGLGGGVRAGVTSRSTPNRS
jgi:transcriptional regulator with XRE-family HTH domain